MFVSGRRQIEFTEEDLREAVARSRSWAETLRNLGYCPGGGNPRTAKKYTALWSISTAHFDPAAVCNEALRKAKGTRPLAELLVPGSTCSRAYLKRRLYQEGLRKPLCEMCGQGELWHGSRITLILDHINGIRDDNRLENLQIVCPNCAATLPTHCGRSLKKPVWPRQCDHCGEEYRPSYARQRFCSRHCAAHARGKRAQGRPKPESRKVDRPPYEQLLAEIDATSFLAVGRKYGVSDNAVRKWLRWYELQRERESAEGDASEEVA
jgi:hypothetical protein